MYPLTQVAVGGAFLPFMMPLHEAKSQRSHRSFLRVQTSTFWTRQSSLKVLLGFELMLTLSVRRKKAALHYAAGNDQIACIEALVQMKADVSMGDKCACLSLAYEIIALMTTTIAMFMNCLPELLFCCSWEL
jgi:hypothetical protein